MEIARNAVDSGAWVLLEYENGKVTLGRKPAALGDVAEYMSMQKRFAGIGEDAVATAAKNVTDRYAYLEKLAQIG